MFGVGIIEMIVIVIVLLALLAVPVALVLLTVGALRRGPDLEATDGHVAQGRRHQTLTSAVAWLAALAALPLGALLARAFGEGNVVPLLPSLVVVAACLVLWMGELTFPRPGGTVRSTVLNARTTATVTPPAWLRLVVGLAVVDLVVFLVGAVTADGGDSFTWQDGATTRSRSPYPGLLYVLPQTLALLVAAGLAWLVVRSATNRSTIPTDLEGDLSLRRASAARVLRWLAWGLAATAAGDLFIVGLAVQETPGSAGAGVVALILAGLLAVVAVALPFVPVRGPARLAHRQPAGAR